MTDWPTLSDYACPTCRFPGPHPILQQGGEAYECGDCFRDFVPVRLNGKGVMVVMPRAAFAVIVHDGKVVDAAPYGRKVLQGDWQGLDWAEAVARFREAGARFAAIDDS